MDDTYDYIYDGLSSKTWVQLVLDGFRRGYGIKIDDDTYFLKIDDFNGNLSIKISKENYNLLKDEGLVN